jgi:formate hydrogenlyase subunit 6/NADH:ubiquinone oxidoreductase subunit I
VMSHDASPVESNSRPTVLLHRLRWVTRAVALLAGTVLLYLPVNGHGWPMHVSAISPLVCVALVLVTHSAPWTILPAAAVALMAMVRRRWFCHWVCPTGCCADGVSWLGRRCGRRSTRFPAVGGALAALILIGACLGYPLLLWTDPLALWSGAVGVGIAPSHWAALAGIGGLACALLVSFLWPQLWCSRLCPLGSLQDWIAQGAAQCLKFGRRLAQPPTGPTSAGQATPPRARLSRRVALGSALGLSWGWCQQHWPTPVSRPLRPPGAAPERQFTSLCVRCGNCLRACPTEVIAPADLNQGLTGWLTPTVTYNTGYCLESCNRCTTVCPSGALTFVALERKLQAIIGVPRVDMNVCLLGDDRDCRVCRNQCPFAAIRLEFDEEQYTLVPRVDMHRCPGCGACEVACPTTPRKAITVRPL